MWVITYSIGIPMSYVYHRIAIAFSCRCTNNFSSIRQTMAINNFKRFLFITWRETSKVFPITSSNVDISIQEKVDNPIAGPLALYIIVSVLI